MFQRMFANIKKSIFFIAIILFLRLLIVDFNNYSLDSAQVFIYETANLTNNDFFNTIIEGVRYVPQDIVIKMVNNNQYDMNYDLLLEDLKVITISDDRKKIIVEENEPIFKDNQYIYLSSGEKIDIDLDISNKDDLAYIDLGIIYDNRKAYSESIRRIRKFINYLKSDYNDLYRNLRKVAYDSSRGDRSYHLSLSLFVDECQIIFSDESGGFVELKQKDFEGKVSILNNFLIQDSRQIDEVSKIDLRYSDYDQVFFNLKNKEGIDG